MSIIIPCYNEEMRIKELICKIRFFQKENFDIEIIVVDNGSLDDTYNIAKGIATKIAVLKDCTIAKLRNHGAKIAEGKILGFIDADCIPSEDWAFKAISILNKDEKIGVVGSYYGVGEYPTWVEKAWREMRREIIGSVNFLPAGNIAVRKHQFLELGGFPEELITGEDYALCLKYRKRDFLIWNEPRMSVIHFGNYKTLNDILKREIWYGQGMMNTIKEREISFPFIAANSFLLGVILIFLAVIIPLQYIPASISFYGIKKIGLGFIALPILAYTIMATIKSGKPKNIFFYFPIFSSYIVGRVVSLIHIYAGKKKRRK